MLETMLLATVPSTNTVPGVMDMPVAFAVFCTLLGLAVAFMAATVVLSVVLAGTRRKLKGLRRRVEILEGERSKEGSGTHNPE